MSTFFLKACCQTQRYADFPRNLLNLKKQCFPLYSLKIDLQICLILKSHCLNRGCTVIVHSGIISVLAISYLSATSFTLSLMCCVHERSPTSWSVERICRQWLRCHAFFCRHLFPMAFLSIVSFLSIEKQMMLREWRRAATHHKSLINWAMRVLAKEILGFKCVLSETFLVRVAFFGDSLLSTIVRNIRKSW